MQRPGAEARFVVRYALLHSIVDFTHIGRERATHPTGPGLYRRISVAHGQDGRDHSAEPSIPTPAVGAGSADLRTTSDDPVELQRLLALAQERLAFYESFDRIVGENVRRSGELMLERISLREQAAEAARVREEREAALAGMEGTIRALLRDLMDEVETLRSGLDDIQDRLQAIVADGQGAGVQAAGERPASVRPTGSSSAASPMDEDSPIPEQSAHTVEMEAGGAVPALADGDPQATPGPEPERERETWDAPRVVELIAHGVPRAADALALQRYLGGLDHVVGVEAREFAEGVLRLQITARSPISSDDIDGWPDHPDARVLQQQAKVIEIDCASA